MRKCDSCGKLYQENKDVFCPHCGAVAEKQCTHGSSFDSGRYDRGEIYKTDTQYKNTVYNRGSEPHAQRKDPSYNKPQNNEDYGSKTPQINLPDFKTILSKGKTQNGKPLVGIVVFVVILVLNAITSLVGEFDIADAPVLWEDVSGIYVGEEMNELYTIVDKATIEVDDTDGAFTKFTLEISGMGFDDYLPDNIQNDISSGAMAEDMLSEYTFVKALVCSFKKEIVSEESYNDTVYGSFYCSGSQVGGECKYEFNYDFGYDEIVHIADGVSFSLEDGRCINAELPFSAFSVSEDGVITYYTSYADEQTAWNTVFSECSNEQETGRDLSVEFSFAEIPEEK